MNSEENKDKKAQPKEVADSEKETSEVKKIDAEDIPGLSWETKHKETDSFDLPSIDKTQCWNCKGQLTGEDWCNNCKAPINEEFRTEVMSRAEPLSSGKCWRCKGTTSGDICGICGSPLTQKGIEIISEAIKPEAKYEREDEEQFIFILSPRDRQLVKVSAKFSEIEGIVEISIDS